MPQIHSERFFFPLMLCLTGAWSQNGIIWIQKSPAEPAEIRQGRLRLCSAFSLNTANTSSSASSNISIRFSLHHSEDDTHLLLRCAWCLSKMQPVTTCTHANVASVGIYFSSSTRQEDGGVECFFYYYLFLLAFQLNYKIPKCAYISLWKINTS